MKNVVLGLGHDLWISSAAIAIDGQISFAIAEERLNRKKNYRGYPKKSINEAISHCKIEFEDIKKVVVGWNPTKHMGAYHGRFLNETRWRPEYLYNIPAQLSNLKESKYQEISIILDKDVEVEYIDHHLAHASGSVGLSGFEQCFYYVLDGVGEVESSYYGVYENGEFNYKGSEKYPNSIGLLYSAITQFLGFKPHSDEWKIMALSAYSNRTQNRYVKKLRNLIEVDAEGAFRLDTNYVAFHLPEQYDGAFTNDLFEKYIGLKRTTDKSRINETDYLELAAAIQFVFEDVVFEILEKKRSLFAIEKFCLSGGCFMNSVFNGKLANKWGSENIYIGPAPDDSGIAIGAAYWGSGILSENHGGRKKISQAYLGRSFDDGVIENTLKTYKLPYIKYEKTSELIETVAKRIASGDLVGWFQGRSEFGQRALGNRSILADPRKIDVKSKINLAVKFREEFRPFAPSILKEKVGEYFLVEPNFESSFMEKVAIFKPDVRHKVPGVVHEDGSGRLQTVAKNDNSLYYALIEKFGEITDIPILLNTSFNVNGEPNVDSPSDAIRTFFTCGLDVLVLGNFVIYK